MSKALIKQFIETSVHTDGLVETGIKGVQLFRVTESIRCAPAVYEPSITAIVNGSKEAIWDGTRRIYDSSEYICCTMSMPVETGTPCASIEEPLLGVYITLDAKMMTEIALELENVNGSQRRLKTDDSLSVEWGSNTNDSEPQGFSLAHWDMAFTDALYRLLQLVGNDTDVHMLAESRLRELYYAVLKGEAGQATRGAFGVGNEIARSIKFLSTRIHEGVTIEDIADQVGMSRAVFHRKFKQATNMSPIQFVKAMRLNNAAVKIASGINVNVAAMEVGYASSSQFSREFKRMYGLSPKQWSQHQPHHTYQR